MSAILDLVKDHEAKEFSPGDTIIEQGESSGVMLVLIEGQVEIFRDEVCVAKTSQPGAIFGEMSVLLGSPHTATVRVKSQSKFAVIENPRQFLERSSQASMHVAELLANRLDALTKYLIDVKRQYEGHDHLGMVDSVLESLTHRPRAPRAR